MKAENMNLDFLRQVLDGNVEDHWYHYGVSNKDSIMKKIVPVKAVIVAGSGERTQRFANQWAKLSGGGEIIAFPKEERFIFRYVNGVIFSSHGMGMPSASIALQELMKMVYFLKEGELGAMEEIFWLRVGTCGGLGVPGGHVAISTAGLEADGKPYRLKVGGEEYRFQGEFPEKVSTDLAALSEKMQTPYILGKTVGCNDFYLEQGRLDGAVRLMEEEAKARWLKRLYDMGVRNIEMETPMFAALLNHWGFSRFGAVCAVLLDRLEGDQVRASKEECDGFVANAENIMFRYLEQILKNP